MFLLKWLYFNPYVAERKTLLIWLLLLTGLFYLIEIQVNFRSLTCFNSSFESKGVPQFGLSVENKQFILMVWQFTTSSPPLLPPSQLLFVGFGQFEKLFLNWAVYHSVAPAVTRLDPKKPCFLAHEFYKLTWAVNFKGSSQTLWWLWLFAWLCGSITWPLNCGHWGTVTVLGESGCENKTNMRKKSSNLKVQEMSVLLSLRLTD